MELPAGTRVFAPRTLPGFGWAGAVALAFVVLYTLPIAAGGGYVFYASIELGSPDFNFPSGPAVLLMVGAWLLGPVPLLIAGLVHLIRDSRHKWWSSVAWVGAVAAGTTLGYVVCNDYGLLFSGYTAPSGPYWQALFAAGGQLAVGFVMTALITAQARRELLRARLTWESAPR